MHSEGWGNLHLLVISSALEMLSHQATAVEAKVHFILLHAKETGIGLLVKSRIGLESELGSTKVVGFFESTPMDGGPDGLHVSPDVLMRMGVFRIRPGAVGHGCMPEMMVGSVIKSITPINGEQEYALAA